MVLAATIRATRLDCDRSSDGCRCGMFFAALLEWLAANSSGGATGSGHSNEGGANHGIRRLIVLSHLARATLDADSYDVPRSVRWRTVRHGEPEHDNPQLFSLEAL